MGRVFSEVVVLGVNMPVLGTDDKRVPVPRFAYVRPDPVRHLVAAGNFKRASLGKVILHVDND